MKLNHLQDIGLSEKEALVYVGLLACGISTVTELANHSGVRRTTCYQALSVLIERGLAKEVSVGAVQKFRAEPPESLVRWCTERYQREQVSLEKARTAAYELEKEYPLSTGLCTRVYPLSEMLPLYTSLAQRTKKMKMFGSVESMIATMGTSETKRLFRECAESRVLMRYISTQSTEAVNFSRMNYLYHRETVLISHINEPSIDIVVWDSAVTITNYRDGTIIAFYHNDLSLMVDILYEHMWTRCTQMGIHYALPKDIQTVSYPRSR